jgi:nucleoside-diphosphate-sugar epimerase
VKVLITGCCGFVGRHFTRRLVDDGHDVTGIDNMSAGIYPADWAFKPKRPIHAWMFAAADLRNWIRNRKPDYDLIVHCAAVVGGRLKIDGDPLAVATDLAIDADLFSWIARHKFKGKLVYFSSSAVYPVDLQGEQFHLSLNESLVDLNVQRIGMPDMTYGWAKLTGEYLAKHAVEKYGMDVVIYRPFSGYGEDQSLDYPFPSIMQRVARGYNPVTIWSNAVRDFIHIDDVVEAVLKTKDQLKSGEVLNLGSGRGIGFGQLAVIAGGPRTTLKLEDDKPRGVYYRVSDPYRMLQLYTPKVSLEEGIRRSLDFHRGKV